MFSHNDSMRYWLFNEPRDVLKSYFTLSGLVRDMMGCNALNGDVYIFINKSRNRPECIASLPKAPIHKCMADSSLLTEIFIQKYLYHIPFHRQILRFRELGVNISSSTIGDWFSCTCELLKPLYDKLKEQVLKSDYIQIDETTLPVIDNEKRRAVKGYIWVVRNPDNGKVFFFYDRGSRSERTAMLLLHNYNGAIQSDGYKVYNKFEDTEGKYLLGCWAHARRKFEEALDENKTLASEALVQIQQLYAIERFADENNLTHEQRATLRKDKAYPLIKRFEKWLFDSYKGQLEKSRIGKAISYTFAIIPKLSRYVSDGRYKIDNNLVENAIRPLAIGRKNYLFCGNDQAAVRAAIAYSLIGTCKSINISPTQWLEDVLKRIPEYENGKRDISELLPHNWAKSRAQS